MKIERSKNAGRNIIYGVTLKLYQILVPFIMRTVMIYFLGFQYLGLNSLFASVLQVLNLAELGVGSAMVYSMYEPIASDDPLTICALMKLYKSYYFLIGLVIAAVGTALTPFIPKLISGEVPADINVYILYLLNLSATIASYWLFAYKNSILQAHQRNDIISRVTIITNTIQYVLQLIALIIFKSYYLFVVVLLLAQIATNIVTAHYANKLYPNFKPEGNLDAVTKKQINRRIRDLFTSKVGSVVLNSADTIVISAFLGLTTLAVYQNYYFIVSSVIGVISIIYASCLAGIGNSLVVESKDKNFEDFSTFTFIISWISGFCSCCLLCLFQPFIELWTGPHSLLPFSVVILLVLYFYIYETNQLLNLYKDAGGIWHEDRYRPLITSFTNLLLNIILVQFLGIYGIILSTVVATLFVGMPWLFNNLFSTLFKKKYGLYYLKRTIFYFLNSCSACIATYVVCSFLKTNNIISLGLRLIICCVIPNIYFYVVYRKRKEFHRCLELVSKITKRRARTE